MYDKLEGKNKLVNGSGNAVGYYLKLCILLIWECFKKILLHNGFFSLSVWE